jgi:hypothetical protein
MHPIASAHITHAHQRTMGASCPLSSPCPPVFISSFPRSLPPSRCQYLLLLLFSVPSFLPLLPPTSLLQIQSNPIYFILIHPATDPIHSSTMIVSFHCSRKRFPLTSYTQSDLRRLYICLTALTKEALATIHCCNRHSLFAVRYHVWMTQICQSYEYAIVLLQYLIRASQCPDG